MRSISRFKGTAIAQVAWLHWHQWRSFAMIGVIVVPSGDVRCECARRYSALWR